MRNINLNKRKFRTVTNSANSDVSMETEFYYRQQDNAVWATYSGGNIKLGTLIGTIKGNAIRLLYQQLTLNNEFLTGCCDTIVSIENGKMQLNEKWRWTCKDYSEGSSTLEEI